jgi:uncharacterized damage-inducible protein DinB
MKFDSVFSDSFDTFKVFDNLTVLQSGLTNHHSPKSIWQILHHLVTWQDYQLAKLRNSVTQDVSETETWPAETNCSDQRILNTKIRQFETQIEQLKLELSNMTVAQADIEQKLKIVQDMTVHLSFHLGEIVLIMRQNGHYPMPGEMKHFLNAE